VFTFALRGVAICAARLGGVALTGRTAIFQGVSMQQQKMTMVERQSDDDNGDNDGRRGGDGTGVGVATRTRTRTKKPTPYRVLMLNDDYTPMEFVVLCLQRFFRMSTEEATNVMLHVHQKGVGVCGIFSYEVAETKVTQVMDFARQNQHPLQCTLEKA
jgi:ATP-dependent Clp protease adaptor protein ClpS